MRGGDAKIDVAYFFGGPTAIMFLGPMHNYKSLAIQSYGRPIHGLVDVESVPDGQVQRYRFTIDAGPANPVALTVEPVHRD